MSNAAATLRPVSRRRCVRHSEREAAARCTACAQDYCRECVSDHGGRLLCAVCLTREAKAQAPKKRSFFSRLRRPVLTACGILLVWLVWYEVGRILTRIPHDVHDGSVWKRGESSAP